MLTQRAWRAWPALLGLGTTALFLLLASARGLELGWTRSRTAWLLCFVFNACLLVTTISSAIIPATGPFYYLDFPAALQQALPPNGDLLRRRSLRTSGR